MSGDPSATAGRALRLYVVEDNPLLRHYVVELLRGAPGFEVLGQAGSAEAALTELPGLAVDIALVDLGLPGESGQALIAKLGELPQPPLMVAHTVFDDRPNVLAAIKAGASGYVLKGGPPRELVEALGSVWAGGAPMSPRIARAVLRELQQPATDAPDVLSPQQRHVLRLVDEGLTYKQIAERLSVSAHTVHSHIKNIYERLQAKSRGEALSKARRQGLL